MKKIIPIILVVAILAGLGYFFMANKFAMTTLISQDKAKIASTYDRAVKALTTNQLTNILSKLKLTPVAKLQQFLLKR